MICPACGQENRESARFCDGCAASLTTSSADQDATPTFDGFAPSERFVGRQEELSELKAALEDALSGQGRLVMLAGEPGIGKTRTTQELATYAETQGAQVLWGWCYEEEGAPPYWPWVQPIRAYVLQRDPEVLSSQMGPGAAVIAEIVPGIREKIPGMDPPPALESPEQSRFRLFDSITTFLKTAASSRPIMLVLDDLHWADQPSLLLLQFLSRQIGDSCLLVVGCYRDMELSRQHPLAEALGELTRTQGFHRVLLRGLSREDTGRCVERTIGVAPPPGILEAVHQQSEGNPLFVTEIARLMTLTGESTAEPGGQHESANMRIPEGIREVIGRRLNRMSQDCNEALATASVIGREFALEKLRLIVESLSEGRLLEVLNEALDARIIEELRPQVGRYQFTHALVQETLVDEIPLTGQVQLHARVAIALEELYGAGAVEHAAELAHHFGQAQTLLGTEKLIRYSLSAGEQALAAYAYEEALRHFERGLTAKGVPQSSDEPASDAEAATLLFGLGRAQSATLERRQRPEAIATMLRAFDYYAEAGDVDLAVAVAGDPLLSEGVEGSGATQAVARALSLVPPDSHAAGRLLCNYGLGSYHRTADY